MCLHVKVESYNWVNCLIPHGNFQCCSIPDFETSLLFWYLVYFGGLSGFERTSGMILENTNLNFKTFGNFGAFLKNIRSLVCRYIQYLLAIQTIRMISDTRLFKQNTMKRVFIYDFIWSWILCGVKEGNIYQNNFCQMISLFEIYQVWISTFFILQD